MGLFPIIAVMVPVAVAEPEHPWGYRLGGSHVGHSPHDVLARALVAEADVVLVDDPLGVRPVLRDQEALVWAALEFAEPDGGAGVDGEWHRLAFLYLEPIL